MTTAEFDAEFEAIHAQLQDGLKKLRLLNKLWKGETPEEDNFYLGCPECANRIMPPQTARIYCFRCETHFDGDRLQKFNTDVLEDK